MVLLEQKCPPLFEEGLQRGGIEPIVSLQLASVEPHFAVDQRLVLDDHRRDLVPVEPAFSYLTDMGQVPDA